MSPLPFKCRFCKRRPSSFATSDDLVAHAELVHPDAVDQLREELSAKAKPQPHDG